MRAVAAAALVLAVWAQGAVAQEGLPDGYPPKMGEISGTFGGKPVAWETFDFSVGAFDASAWADRDWETRQVMAHLMGYEPGKPDEMTDRLFVEGDFGKALRTGRAQGAVVLIVQGQDLDGPRLSSEGRRSRFWIDSIGPKVEDSYSRRVTGRLEARVCPVNWPGQGCRDLVLRFDTDMQMDSELPVTP